MVRRIVAGRLGELALAMIKGIGAEESENSPGSTKSELKNSPTPGTGPESNSGDTVLPNSIGAINQIKTEVEPTNSSESQDSKPAETPAASDSANENAPTAGDQTKSEEGVNKSGKKDDWADFELDPESERSYVLNLIVPMFGRLIADDQESVRLMAVESIVGLIKALGPSEAENKLVEMIEQAVADKSWRVRCTMVDKFIDMFTTLGPNISRSRLVPLFIDLLHDEEVEVRAVAAGKVKAFARCLLGLPPSEPETQSGADSNPDAKQFPSATSDTLIQDTTPACSTNTTTTTTTESTSNCPVSQKDVNMEEVWAMAAADETIVSSLLPAIKSLTTDSNTHVRSALASAVLGLAPLLGSTLTVEHLLPVLLAYLKDDSPEVRFNLISNLEHVNSVIGIDHLSSSLLPAVIQLAEDPKWRVRLVIIEYMPMLAEQLGKEVFNNQLTDICLGWLIDEVYAIREAAVDNLVRLGHKFGTDWVNTTFVPKVIQLATERNYLRRMICLQSIISLSEIVGPSVCKQHLLPTTLSMQNDSVPNVRFKVAQALSKLGSQLNKKDLDEGVHQCLKHLAEDTDRDVKFYAYEALDNLHLVARSDDTNDVVMTPAQPEARIGTTTNEPADPSKEHTASVSEKL
ncbi:unnamed protein product [Echinostoma caproni]|uniref:TOG domain-containing protein n=1 Tax=Echinostoma caproni TaxID=27848 RepID=A0A183AVY3_9TREM|nr:unnamed protein product [Echinostoma caproni]